MTEVDDDAVHVERPAMGISHDDFFRVFPSVVGAAAWHRDGLSIRVEWPLGGRLVASVSPQKVRRIASLSLPYVDVGFDFHGMGAADRASFLLRFDTAFHKGGG